RQTLEASVSNSQGAAVARVRYHCAISAVEHCRDRRAHSEPIAPVPRSLMNAVVRALDGRLEPRAWRRFTEVDASWPTYVGIDEALADTIDGHLRDDLACRSASEAVGHDQDADLCEYPNAIFVGHATPPGIRRAGAHQAMVTSVRVLANDRFTVG